MKQRRNERTDYRHFPPEYVDLLQRFKSAGSIRFGPMSERQANAMRREWYRYASFLRNADPTDDYARDLSAIATNMVWSVGPQDVDHPADDDYFLNAYLNPIVAAMRKEDA
jgi:hypothetical protein